MKQVLSMLLHNDRVPGVRSDLPRVAPDLATRGKGISCSSAAGVVPECHRCRPTLRLIYGVTASR